MGLHVTGNMSECHSIFDACLCGTSIPKPDRVCLRDDPWHGASRVWCVQVEDQDSEVILHKEFFYLKMQNAVGDRIVDHSVAFTVPISDPLPPQYFIRVVSDRWLGSESVVPVRSLPSSACTLPAWAVPSSLVGAGFQASVGCGGFADGEPLRLRIFRRICCKGGHCAGGMIALWRLRPLETQAVDPVSDTLGCASHSFHTCAVGTCCASSVHHRARLQGSRCRTGDVQEPRAAGEVPPTDGPARLAAAADVCAAAL